MAYVYLSTSKSVFYLIPQVIQSAVKPMPPPGGDKKYEKIGGPNAEEFILRGGKNNQEVIDWNFRATLEVVKGGIRSNKTGENFLQRRLLEVKSVRRLRLSDKMGLGDTNNPSAMVRSRVRAMVVSLNLLMLFTSSIR